MTEIVVASRAGILRAPDGEQFRLVPGKTLADARHPGVLANPDSFMPVEVELSVDDPEESDPRRLEDAETEAESLRQVLTTISDGLEVRALIPEGTDTAKSGWLVETLFAFIDTAISADGHTMDGQLEAVPPPAPRPRKPRVARA